MIATFLENPDQGEVWRRTAYVRNNGAGQNGAELHDPLQPLRAPRLPGAAERAARHEQTKTVKTKTGERPLIPSLPAGFGCPCHGGQYDTEGNRTAGPPVRALDRYDFLIKNGNLLLGSPYSVGKVEGAGADARDHKYKLHGPGPARRRPGAGPLPDPAAPVMATPPARASPTQPQARGDRSPARLARGALGPGRRRPLLPLPQGPVRHELDADARLGDADRLPRPGDHRRDPGDVLQARPGQRLRVDPAHHERPRRSAGSCAGCTAGAPASSSS